MPKRSRPNDIIENPTRGADKASWTRIMNKRRQDFDQLGPSKIQTILTKVPQAINSSSMDLDGKSPKELLEEMLWEHMQIAGDATQPASHRRDSWAVVAATFSQVDVELNRTPMHPQSTIATARSVFDRINLSSTSSTMPAGSRIPVATQPQTAASTMMTVARSVARVPIVHPLMRKKSKGIIATAIHIPTALAALGNALPIHPVMLGRVSSTSSTGAAATVPQGTSAITDLVQQNTTTAAAKPTASRIATTTTPAPTVAATETTTTTTTRRPSATTTTASTAARLIGNTTANGSVPIHPSVIRGSASTTTTVPVHPSMRGNSSSSRTGNAAAASAAALTLDAALNKMATSATTAATTTATTTASVTLPIHPSLQRNPSGTAAVATPAPRAASVATSSNTNTGSLPVHPSMQRKQIASTTTGARTTTATSTGAATTTTTTITGTTGSIGGSKSGRPTNTNGGTTATLGTTANRNTVGSSSSSSKNKNGQSFVSVDKNRTTQAEPTAVLDSSNPVVSRPTNPTTYSGSSDRKRTAGPLNTMYNGGNRPPGSLVTTNNYSKDGSSSSSTAGQTQPNTSQPRAAQPPANQGASSSTASGQNTASFKTTASKTTTAMAIGTTATNPKSTTAVSKPTAFANGSTTTNRTAVGGAAAKKSATKAGQNGTVPNGVGDKPKENRKPAATTKPKKSMVTPPIKLVVSQKMSMVVLPPDSGLGSLTGCCDTRPKCIVKYHRYTSVPGMDTVSKRLSSTEPYWHLMKAVGSGMTAKADRLEWPTGRGSGTNVPKTVWSMTLLSHNMKEISNKVKKWGEPSNDPESLECRLFLRMLPVNVTEKMKAKRADCHLWPKGTMLVLDGKPQELSQRKQQSHAKSEWKGMCKHFDLSSIIEKPLDSHTIQICSTDDEPYWVSIGLCQYRPPEFHVRKLLGMEPESSSNPKNHRLQRLSLEASKTKLKQFLDQPAIVLDDDDDGNESKPDGVGVGKIVCPLVDSHSMVVIKTAVRGKQCKHFSCFDLETFMIESRVVSGTRWRCHCCETFLKYHELQSCALTQEVLDKFKDQVTASRKRVEFRADETYELLPEDNRLRYSTVSTKQAPGEPDTRPAQQNDEVIDLVDSD